MNIYRSAYDFNRREIQKVRGNLLFFIYSTKGPCEQMNCHFSAVTQLLHIFVTSVHKLPAICKKCFELRVKAHMHCILVLMQETIPCTSDRLPTMPVILSLKT
jgi:hypothetical protein